MTCVIASLFIAISLTALGGGRVAATQQETGVISCAISARHSFLTVRYSDWVGAWAPGISSAYYYGY